MGAANYFSPYGFQRFPIPKIWVSLNPPMRKVENNQFPKKMGAAKIFACEYCSRSKITPNLGASPF